MKVVLDGPPPTWVAACTDQALRARVGPGSYARGATYARERAVTTLTLQQEGRRLDATVKGSGRMSYRTVVSAPGSSDGAGDWSGHCTCPVGVDCKHVAAVLLTTRGWLSKAAPAPAPASTWEMQLAGLVRSDARESEVAPLGLQLEVVQPARAATPRVRLRPVTPGKAGRWIKSGVAWREIDSGYGAVRVRAEQRAVVRTLLATYRGRTSSSYYSYSEPQVYLDDLGPGVWQLLGQARDAGIVLVGRSSDEQVEVAAGPAATVLDLRQADPGAPAALVPLVRVPSEGDLPARDVALVGRPAHGLFVASLGRLLLAPFDRPLGLTAEKLLGAPRVEIPADEVPRFVSHYYPSLRQQVEVESGDGSVDLPEIEPPRLALQVAFEPGHVTTLHWSFRYSTLQVPLAAEGGELVRDRATEQALLGGLQRAVPAELAPAVGLAIDLAGRPALSPERRLTGMDTARFADEVLPVLVAHEDIVVEVTGEPAAYTEADEAPLISVAASDSEDAGADWFDLTVAVTVAGEQVPLSPLISALASGAEHLVLDSGTYFRLDRPELQTLRAVLEEARALQDSESDGLRLTPYQAGLWEELVELGVVAHQSERWTRTAGALLDLEELPTPAPPVGLLATLRPYQLDGYRWLSLLWDLQLGGILADDMGLGKTVQTLAMAARASEQGTLGGTAGPLLIVAPTSVVATWAREAARFCPDLRVVAVTETERRSGLRLADATAGVDLVVTSYALLRLDEDSYRDLTWSGLVLDEAQFVKNHQAKTYSCARRLPAPFKLAITGTPLENSLMDLWSMLSITAPGLFTSPQRFADSYCKPIESGRAPEQLAALRRRVRPLLLRRTKDQVAPDLPPKVEQVLEVTLNPQQRRVYDKHLSRERQRVLGLLDDVQRHRFTILRSLTLLRQLSLSAALVDDKHARIRSSKIDVLMEQLREVVDEGHRVLVFSQFTGFLALVRERLAQEGIEHCYLDGRTRNRPKRIAEFTEGSAPVFVISLKAGGVGLTLTEADYVFVLDPWWNPATEAQAIDRTHRIGQDKTVMVYRLVASDTIEQKVVALQQRKRDLFARVVDDEAMTGGALTAEDLRGLFS